MFGWKKFKSNCPFCDFEYSFKFKPKEVDTERSPFPLRNSYGLVNDFDCEFCKRELVVIYSHRDKQALIEDRKLSEDQLAFDDKQEKFLDEIDQLESAIEQQSDPSQKLIDKLERVKVQLAKAEESFAKKEEKYYERAGRAQERLMNKLDREQGR